ncbi:hypothetical protein GCM10009623_15380 [Nocardioides aestuarii]|uniref:Alpha/beta fold hydrolase n=1 Tax=Nocardioides aestuarii TaxID=252231 RepID=A0ABW4TNK1_9ACTN
MPTPQTRYTRAGDAEIAYQTVGSGPVDLVWAYGMMTHLEVKWEEPSLARMLGQLSGFTRLILFDRRGCGLSDRGDRHLAPTLEERVHDVLAVLDAVGSERASLFGVSEGCALAAMFASMHPERTDRVVLYGGMSRLLRDPEHPWGVMDAQQYDAAFGPVFRHWGTLDGAAAHVRLIAPSAVDDSDYLAWFARQQRLSLSRDAVVRFMRVATEYDLDDILPNVQAPTLVLHRSDDAIVPASSARRLASRITHASLVEVPGADHLPYVGDADAIVEAMRAFLGAPSPPPAADVRLVTLVATDAQDPDTASLVARHARRFDGVEVSDPTGGRVTRFDSATRAVRFALGAVRAARDGGVELRAAVHAGECHIDGSSIDGPAAAVVTAALRDAPPGRVVATATVRDIVPGSGIVFADGAARPRQEVRVSRCSPSQAAARTTRRRPGPTHRTTSSGGTATSGRSASRGGRPGCGTARACVTSRCCWPIPAVSGTSSTSGQEQRVTSGKVPAAVRRRATKSSMGRHARTTADAWRHWTLTSAPGRRRSATGW